MGLALADSGEYPRSTRTPSAVRVRVRVRVRVGVRLRLRLRVRACPLASPRRAERRSHSYAVYGSLTKLPY